MKAKNRYIILIVFLSTIWTANAQVNINQFIESVTHSETTFINGLNASVFTIDAPATGNYHIQFWLNPTTSDNVSFQSHRNTKGYYHEYHTSGRYHVCQNLIVIIRNSFYLLFPMSHHNLY